MKESYVSDPCILYPIKLKVILSFIYTSCVVIMKYDKKKKKTLLVFSLKRINTFG